MHKLFIDLNEITNYASQHQAEFIQLKEKVKNIPLSQFDALAHPIVEEITNAIDCTQCGNCCRVQEPGINMQEIEVLAKLKQVSVEDFKNDFIAWDAEGVSFLCEKPCGFLNGNKCSIYQHRPHSCADFPGLLRPRLKWRMKQVEENYSICPIVFNVVEKLKQVL